MIKKLKQQVEEIAEELKLRLKFDDNLGFEDTRFCFSFPNSTKGYCIEFGFCSSNFDRLVYCISCNEQYKEEYRTQIINRLGKGLGWDNYVWLTEFENPLRYWGNNAEPWLAIIDGSLKDNIKEKTKTIIKNLEGFNL